jgi:hypothetical protein
MSPFAAAGALFGRTGRGIRIGIVVVIAFWILMPKVQI